MGLFLLIEKVQLECCTRKTKRKWSDFVRIMNIEFLYTLGYIFSILDFVKLNNSVVHINYTLLSTPELILHFVPSFPHFPDTKGQIEVE